MFCPKLFWSISYTMRKPTNSTCAFLFRVALMRMTTKYIPVPYQNKTLPSYYNMHHIITCIILQHASYYNMHYITTCVILQHASYFKIYPSYYNMDYYRLSILSPTQEQKSEKRKSAIVELQGMLVRCISYVCIQNPGMNN